MSMDVSKKTVGHAKYRERTRNFFCVVILATFIVYISVWPTVSYFKDIFAWKAGGEHFYRAFYEAAGGPGSRCPVFDAFGGHVLPRFDDVKKRLLDLDDSLKRGDTVRHNWLGPIMFNSKVMIGETFSLGLPFSNHTRGRKFLDNSLWGMLQKWSPDAVSDSVERFLSNRRSLSLPNDAREFVITFLAEQWLGLKVPGDFDVAAFVHSYQNNRLFLGMVPEWVFVVPGLNSMAIDIQAQNEALVKAIEAGLERQYPEITSTSARREFAVGALDALTYAGGLSVADLITRALGSLWNKHGDLGGDGFRLSRKNVFQVVGETGRLYPPVSNIAYERLKPFAGSEISKIGREILAIGPILRDPTLWGPDAEEFKLRGDDSYNSDFFVAFADLAPERWCPGKDLARILASEFLLVFDALKWRRVGGGLIEFSGYGCEDFEVEW